MEGGHVWVCPVCCEKQVCTADAILAVETWSPLLAQTGLVFSAHKESPLQQSQPVFRAALWSLQHQEHRGPPTHFPPMLANSTPKALSGFSWPLNTQRLKLWFHQKMWQALTALVGSPLPPWMNGRYSIFYMVVPAALRSLVLGFSWTWFCVWFSSPFNHSLYVGRKCSVAGRVLQENERKWFCAPG